MGKKVRASERAHSNDNSKDLVPHVGTSLPVLPTAWGVTMTSFSYVIQMQHYCKFPELINLCCVRLIVSN